MNTENDDDLHLTNLDLSSLDNLSLVEKDNGCSTFLKKVENPWDVSHIQRYHEENPYPETKVRFLGGQLTTPKALRKGSVINADSIRSPHFPGRYNFKIIQKVAVGGFATIYKAENEKKPLIIKVEETTFPWETMILDELKRRLNEVESLRNFTQMLPDVYLCIRYENVTCMLMEELPQGTLLEYQQHRMKYGLDIGKQELAIRLMELVYALHSVGILHGDIKPDNFMVVGEDRDKQHRSVPILKLIDFGRAIDLRSYPPNTAFTKSSKTDAFECYQMTHNQPWNYHIDLYSLAGTMYVILFGKYMKVVESQTGEIAIPDRRVSTQWYTFFNKLLNFETPTESSCPDISNSPLPELLKYFQSEST